VVDVHAQIACRKAVHQSDANTDATLQAQKIADFFSSGTTRLDIYHTTALLSVEGRLHDVQVIA